MRKKIEPAAIHALCEALTYIYWYRGDLRKFIESAVSIPNVLSQIDWGANKRDIVATIVSHLQKHPEKYQDALLSLMVAVAGMKDFSHLRRLDGGEGKAKIAQEAVKALRAYITGYQNELEEIQKREARREAAVEKLERVRATEAKLADMKQVFFSILTADAQQRGYKLETFLRDLFEIHDLDPKASFKLVGEQIDGAFTFETNDFLLEAKWEQKPLPREPLDAFQAKVLGKLDNTLGLFISINGYSDGAIATYAAGTRKLAILMDGSHLNAVIDGRIPFPDLLRRLRRHASQTGEVYLPIESILGTKPRKG